MCGKSKKNENKKMLHSFKDYLVKFFSKEDVQREVKELTNIVSKKLFDNLSPYVFAVVVYNVVLLIMLSFLLVLQWSSYRQQQFHWWVDRNQQSSFAFEKEYLQSFITSAIASALSNHRTPPPNNTPFFNTPFCTPPDTP
jgi:maltodextrin utilization protein YvdJ